MVPSTFVTLEALPLTLNGKVDRRALVAISRSTSELDRTALTARDMVELQLSRIWEGLLDISPVGVRDSFFDLGGHSMMAVRLMAHIQNSFGQDLPLSVLFQRTTIEELAMILRRQDELPVNSPLVAIQSGGTKSPFFCIHPIGGNVLCFIELSHCLGTDQPFYGLQSVSLYDENIGYKSVQEMAACYIDAIRTVQPQGPYLLGGYSFGGCIAYEMARQLSSQKQDVEMLVLIDSFVPVDAVASLDDREEEADDAMLLAEFAEAEGLPLSPEELQQFEPEARFDYVLDCARKAHILPPDAGLSQIRRLINTYKINMRAMRNYRPLPYQGQVALFRADSSQDRSIDSWGNLITGDFNVQDIPGNHNSIMKSPDVQVLAERLDSVIRKRKGNIE
jgi:thioesterase domain-containing protein